MKSDVYFIEVKSADAKARCRAFQKLLQKVDSLLDYKKDEFIPVKITIGDSPCIHEVKPTLVKTVISKIKEKKAKPFLFDTGVIYTGQRLNAVDHLNLAQNKGFGHSDVGAPFIIADGLLGQDGKEFKINEDHIKRVKIPSFAGLVESLLVLSHVTGHMMSGFAGSIKNVAMGMACRPTKQIEHSSVKPFVIKEKCTACGCCIEICPVKAVSLKGEKAFINQVKCIGCGECIAACKFEAINVNWDEDYFIFCQRMTEVAKFLLSKFKNKFFVNFAFDMTKDCDCMSTKDNPIISENIGILASKDVLSVDKAAADLMGDSIIKSGYPDVYKKSFEYASEKGIGNLDYNLIRYS